MGLEQVILTDIDKKECLHHFVYGYVSDLVIYCKRCGKEIDNLYGNDIYRTHELKGFCLIEKTNEKIYKF